MSDHTAHLPLVLVLAVIGVGCGEEPERVVQGAHDADAIVEQEAHALVDAAKEGGAADTARVVDQAARAAVDTLGKQGGAEAVAEDLAGRVEDSAGAYDKAYDAARASGDNPIEAGGEAYDAVLDTAEERKDEPH